MSRAGPEARPTDPPLRWPSERLEELLEREARARAVGVADLDRAVPDDVVARDPVLLHEVLDQVAERGELLRAGNAVVEVADEADADAVLVVLLDAGVGAVDSLVLAQPARADLDLAVRRLRPVADDEVVAEPVLPLPRVSAVERRRAALVRRRVVDDDV